MSTLQFFINGRLHTIQNVDPQQTVYEYLRSQRITSVKRVCSQGGCGSCAVVVTNYNYATNSFEHRSVNSCLMPLPALAECHVTTTEGIGSTKNGFHAVQQRIARNGGSQCGYCTPGMVMLMYGILQATDGKPTLADIESSFDGNICRCTGYRPILNACHSFAVDCKNLPDIDIEDIGKKFIPYDHSKDYNAAAHVHVEKKEKIKSLHFQANGIHWYRPSALDEALSIYGQHKGEKVRFVVGNTSTGVYGRDLESKVYIDLRYITALQTIEDNGTAVVAGGAVTLSRLMKALKSKNEAITSHLYRVANVNVRNAGSWSGNLVMARTKGFPSDVATVLAGIGATLSAVSIPDGKQVQLNVLDFLNSNMEYLLTSVSIPVINPSERFQSYRASIRYNNSHALVNAAFMVKLGNDGNIETARLVFGVVDRVAKRAEATEKAIIGHKPTHDVFISAANALRKEIIPVVVTEFVTVEDPSGKGPYRNSLPEKFLYKFFLYLNSAHLSPNLLSVINPREISYSTGKQTYTEKAGREALPKLEANSQASGEATYSAEIPIDPTTLHAVVVLATKAGVTIEKIDTSTALNMPGVVTVITAKDIMGANDCGVFPGQEEILATNKSPFVGQPVALVVAETELQARNAADTVNVTYGEFYDGEPIFDIETAVKLNKFDPSSDHSITSGDIEVAMKASDKVIEGKVKFGGQHPFYLERLSAIALKGENGHVTIYTGAQNPSFLQAKVAAAIKVSLNQVTVNVKRIGGGFGGRLTRNVPVAQLAAVACKVTDRPVLIELSIQEDLTLTAGRHAGVTNYKVGVTKDGKILALETTSYVNAGFSTDFSFALTLEFDESLDDIYRIPNLSAKSRAVRTNLSTRTATRSFGHSQAKFVIEHMIQHIAAELNKPPHVISEINMYTSRDCITPYGQYLENWKMDVDWKMLKEKVEFDKRLAEIEKFNQNNKWRKRGIYITGLKYGIHQGYALGAHAQITLYNDGTIFVSHGGCDKGTGVNTKVAQAVALTFGIPVSSVRIGETTTDYIPQTGWNGGSVGSEGNVEAARRAAIKLKDRLQKYKLDLWAKATEKKEPTWNEIVTAAIADNIRQTESDNFIPLGTRSSELMGPKWQTHWCEYFTCGVACSEAEVDILTGEATILRSDIYMDVGDTLNPLIDIGQCEGGFVFGLGYFLQEEELNSPEGKPLYNSTWNYKPLLGLDIPRDFRVELAKETNYPKNVMGFKGIGEPPVVLAYSAVGAIKQAIFASRKERGLPVHVQMDGPFTTDRRSQAAEVSSTDLLF